MKHYVKLDEGYFLTTQVIQSNVTVEVTKKTNHVVIIDVSGSMSYELPQIRKQLKNKLSNIMKDGDTITIIWFSGRNDCGILKEEVEVRSLKTLTDLNDAIDKWLKPVGLTAFLKPLQLTKQVIERISKNRPDSVFSLIFMTDGQNNDVPWTDVLKALNALEGDLASTTIVEYGYYCNSQNLTQMAGILGGEKISCDGFDDFEPMFDAKISQSLKGGKKISVDIVDPFLYDFAFSVTDDGGVILYNLQKGEHGASILVGADVSKIHFFSSVPIGNPAPKLNGYTVSNFDTALYAAIYVLSDKLLNDDAEKIFYALGDNFYYKQLLGAFGKQKLNAFKANIKECVADQAKRFPDGKASIEKVPDDAYCLMNLIEDLGNMEDCLFYPSHPDFVYNRIGRKRVQKGSDLSDDDKKRLSEAKNVAEVQAITSEIEAKNVDLKFVDNDPKAGYALSDLVWHSERANLSLRIKIDGKVILPPNKFNIPEIPTSRYNTFTLIKDGIVNVANLPVLYSKELITMLTDNGVQWYSSAYNEDNNVVVINLNSLPIINKAMVNNISAEELARKEFDLIKIQSQTKVYDYYRKLLFPKESKSYIETYGQEAADWLKEIGITDYNGFNPKSEAQESTDFYMSVNLLVKIKGLSSLPKVEDVVAKLDKGDFKLAESLMAPAIIEYNQQLESSIFKSLDEADQKVVLKHYLIKKSKELIQQKRNIAQSIAETKFSVILSRKWLAGLKSFDDNKLDLTLNGKDISFTFDLLEKEVKI